MNTIIRKIFLILMIFILTACGKKTPASFTVTFDTRGGGIIAPVTVKKGQKAELPVPKRDGYSFGGWYSSPDLSAAFTGDDAVTEDLTLYASWSKQTRRVTFVTGTDEAMESETVVYGEGFSVPKALSREGYRFEGWYTDPSYEQLFEGTDALLQDLTLYAKWKELLSRELPVMNLIDINEEGLKNGCEGAALLMALQSTGHALDYTYQSFMKNVPYSPDDSPYKGFAGSPWEDTNQIDAIMMGPLAEWANQYGNGKDITGCVLDDLKECLDNGHPVVVWTSIQFYPSALERYAWGSFKTWYNVMTLIGYDEASNTFLVADPTGWKEGKYSVSAQTFLNSWSCLRGAVEIW